MHRHFIIIILWLLLISSISFAQITVAQSETVVLSDSLMQLMESRIEKEYGITETSTLVQSAKVMQVELTDLKKQLGLDVKNAKLDNMRLRQLGISVYQVLMAQETIQYGFNETSTLEYISRSHSLPIKKIKSLLKLDPNDPSLNSRSIQSLELTPDIVESAISEFHNTLPNTSGNIILVGMLVVFAALLITSLIILQLRHLNMFTEEKQLQADLRITKSGKVLAAKPNFTNNDIAAVITALHIFRYQIEERRRLNLTFHREKANFWRADGLYTMPNRGFSKK